MPFITETGTIVEITRGARASYQVRLQSGRVLLVGNDQIIPPRVTLLSKGERLVVTFNEHGKVTSAKVKNTLTGHVVRVEGHGSAVLYQVSLENGGSVQVERGKVSPHPDRPLGQGAQIEVSLAEGHIQKARLVQERLEVTVLRVERGQNTVTVRSRQGENTTIRLPGDVLRQVEAGERLWMEVQYGEQGDRHIVLEPSRLPRDRQPSSSGSQVMETPVPSDPTSPHPPLEAEIAGIDPLYLAERKRENHRAEILSFLDEHARDGLVEWYRMRDAVQARFAAPLRPLPPVIQAVLESADPNFKGFYLHQALALDAIRAGKHLVIVTQTASGKTLSYNPAIFERMVSEPGAHALYLFPLNALMTDQKEKIDALCSLLNQRGVPVTAARLQGGMGSERQEIARKSPALLATNPEMLSVILGEPDRWAAFFRTLRYVVIDEVHSYRGIFGVHMSGLLRRLLLTAHQFGANPRLILCSATVSNPLDLAVRLTSLPAESFELIAEDRDGSRQDFKHWGVLNPDWGSTRARYDNYLNVAARVFVELVSGRRGDRASTRPLNTILFARSIRDVNRLYRLVTENLRDKAGRADSALINRIKSYVSAELSTQDKREIYDGLRTGRMIGVISTNALEAGIDIGRLDACIIAGFPFSVMRVRQMAGRVGRQQEGLVVFVPYPLSGLDGYYRDHPDLLLSQPPEVFVVDPENPYVARKHINAAAMALGGITAETLRAVWGPKAGPIAEQAVADGVMRLVNGGSRPRYYGTRRDFSNLEDVYAIHSIRSNNQKPYAVCLDDGAPCQLTNGCFSQQRRGCPRQVTVLDQDYIYRDCHPGAVYESVSDRLYRVTRFDDAQRVVKVQELAEDTLERTSVEEDIQVEVAGAPRAVKMLHPGITLAWGDVVVTRSFTGYRTHTLIPTRSCRRCRKEYSEDTQTCPSCGRATDTSYVSTKPEHVDFPGEHRHGFHIVLKTVACWLAVEPQVENDLHAASPCKLPGENNRVQSWLKSPFNPGKLRLGVDERKRLEEYHARSGADLRGIKATIQEAILYPGTYSQCLLSHLRQNPGSGGPVSESRALEIFGAVTGYPVTDDLRHVCRKCQSSVLMEALHTLEHVVLLRYPSVALGDMSDLGSFSTLGHAGVGKPAVFWFDDYEGGLGAAEKVFEKFEDLLAAAGSGVQDCSCTTIEGCPRCTHVGGCVSGNDALSKPAVLGLINLITGGTFSLGARPFVYRRKRAADFDRTAQQNEYAREAHGIGEEAPERSGDFNPYLVLRVQPEVHECVARKAFDLRSQEIAQEVPPVSAVDLNRAYKAILQGRLLQDWSLEHTMAPYRVLELQPVVSTKMVQQIYHLIALQVHPDANPGRAGWANEMMKIVNTAYDAIMAERKGKA